MATFNQRDIQEVVIGGTDAATAMTTTTIAAMFDGEVGVFSPAGTRLTEATAVDAAKFMLVRQGAQTSSDPVLMTGVFVKSSITNGVRTLQADAVEQEDFIGYDGTTGSINVINDNLYHVRINLHQSITSNIGGLYVKHGIYQSDASATQEEIAQGLTESLINDFSKEPDKQLIAERTNSGVGTAATGLGNLILTGNSKYASCTDADGMGIAVGDYLTLGAATTDACYKVTAIDTTNNIFTLDVAYQAADGQASIVTIADSVYEVIVEATAQAADFGIQLTGVPLYWRKGKINSAVASWTSTLENFGTTALASTGSSAGSGNYEQIAELEWFVKGNEGDYFRMGEPNLYDKNYKVVTDTNYDQIDITFEQTYTGSIVNGPIRKSLTLCIPTTTPNWALAATASSVPEVLEVLVFGASGGEFSVG